MLALVLTTVGWSTPAPTAFPSTLAGPGDPEMVNLQHVYNKTSPGAQADGQGTDIEFFTSTVPLRDYETGEIILDEEGHEILVEKDFAVMGSYGGGAYVYDITDPEAVQFVRRIVCNQTQNDVQIKQFGDRWILALARDGDATPCTSASPYGRPSKGNASGAGLAVFDITDPYDFQAMYSFRVPSGAHNFTFHPTKPFGWVSNGDIIGLSLTGYRATIPIINFTDLENPTFTEISLNGSPHDIAFSPDGTRAYVASENNHQIYDTTDPGNPVQVSLTPNGGTYSHGLDPTPNGNLMIATNESLALGGFFAGGTTVCPGEGLTFYDIAGDREKTPVPVGEYLPALIGRGPDNRACTGHVGRIAPNSRVHVTGWYIGGVRVIDFSNPAQPTEAAVAVMPNTEVWAAKFYKGPYIFAADQRRGFDVYRWSGTGTAPWLAP